MTVEKTFNQKPNDSDHLDFLLPTMNATFKQSQLEVDRMNLIKKIVVSLTISALIAVILWPIITNKEGSFTLAVDRLDERDENAKLIKPRYAGMDGHNNPVNISAETAFRKTNDDKDYYLKNLLADMKMHNGTGIEVIATNGMFNANDQKIILDGTVAITTENGFKLQTEQAIFSINGKIAQGEKGVTGSSPFGEFTADRFEVDIDQEIIKLTGHVRHHFDPDKATVSPEFSDKK